MSNRLQGITDWQERAHAAGYCVRTLAERCGVSVRTLERHCKREFSLCPHDWLLRLRMQRAMELLLDAASVKETAAELGYKNQHHFSREFKKHTGHTPSQPQAAKRLP